MLILSRVCAEFTNRRGQVIFTIPPSKLLSFLEAPEEIREDPLFDSLLADGSLEAVQSLDQRRQLEADPTAAPAPEGKKPRARAKAEAPAAEAEKADVPAATGEAPSGEAAPAAANAAADAAAPEAAPVTPKAARKAKQ